MTIIISNENVPKHFLPVDTKLMTYDEFEDILFSEEGFSETEECLVNINDVRDKMGNSAADIFEAVDEQENIGWFTITDEIPEFGEETYNNDKLKIWIGEVQEETKPAQEQEMTEIERDNFKNNASNPNVQGAIANLIEDATAEESQDYIADNGNNGKEAQITVFGSSKGGTGKTFTSIISTYRYAKKNPNKRIAFVDFDLIDGQVGISIHKFSPTMRNYYNSYLRGLTDFNTMRTFAVKGSSKYPSNIDFYLAPSNGQVVKDDEFWLSVITNLVENYDVVVFDTGIDYLNIRPISLVYKASDRILLVTTTSIKSVSSVSKQISKLTGQTKNNTYSKEDELENKINVIITQMIPDDEMNSTIYNSLNTKAPVVATFGNITASVQRVEYYQEIDIFDDNQSINEALDRIMDI